MNFGAAYIETPPPGPLKRQLTAFVGWVALPKPTSKIEIRLNGEPHRFVLDGVREDVAAAHPGMACHAWRMSVDLPACVDARGILLVDVFVDDQPVQRQYYRTDRLADGAERPLIYFIHAPKTGGTSVRVALEAHASTLNIASVYGREPLDTTDFKRLSCESLSALDVVYGHFTYGLHRQSDRPYRYLTVMRDPYEYLRSAYFFRKFNGADPAFRALRGIDEAFEDERTRSYFDNVLTRHIAGVGDVGKRITEAHVRRAKAALDADFDFVGFTEYMPDTIAALSRYFGVPLDYHATNLTTPTAERAMLDVRAFRIAAEPMVRFDLEIYAYAMEKFWGGGVLRAPERRGHNLIQLDRSDGSARAHGSEPAAEERTLASGRDRG